MFHCADQLGVVAVIAECVAAGGANILSVDLHIDLHSTPPMLYARSEFAFHPQEWTRAAMEKDFEALAKKLNATRSFLHVMGVDPSLKMAILASWQDHCLVDLLYRWQEGELPVDIACVISNRERASNTHVRRFLERHNIAYHYLPTCKKDKREREILELVKGHTDFLVLARYMQVLSPSFLASYGRDIINIHHGLLPSFKGANPYRQAYDAGVKLIGATSHFVTEELDDGPIIEQLVERVSHRDSLAAFALKSQSLEKRCLARAVRHFCQHRIVRYSANKTLVFA